MGIKLLYKHSRKNWRRCSQNLRTNQETTEAENREKIKNSQSQFKIYWFLSKKSEYIVYILLYCRLQSRSQDFARGEEGLFWKFDTTENELDPNFH